MSSTPRLMKALRHFFDGMPAMSFNHRGWEDEPVTVRKAQLQPVWVAYVGADKLNAFDALLAVAKAVVEKHERRTLLFGESEWDPAEFETVIKLNAQHPGWRTWS